MRPLVRKNPANGAAEVSPDGGRTWQLAPEPPAGSPGAVLSNALRGVAAGIVDAVKKDLPQGGNEGGRPTIPVR